MRSAVARGGPGADREAAEAGVQVALGRLAGVVLACVCIGGRGPRGWSADVPVGQGRGGERAASGWGQEGGSGVQRRGREPRGGGARCCLPGGRGAGGAICSIHQQWRECRASVADTGREPGSEARAGQGRGRRCVRLQVGEAEWPGPQPGWPSGAGGGAGGFGAGGPGGRGGGQGQAGARERQAEPGRGSEGRGQGGKRLGCKG